MSDIRVQQMLDAQQSQADPFQQAQNAFAKSRTGDQDLMLGNPMDPNAQTAGMQQKLIDPAQPNTFSATSLLNKQSAKQDNAFMKKLPGMLQSMGIKSDGIVLNDVGRMQLIGRLKARYGDQYSENSDALRLLNDFDLALKEFPLTARKSTNSSVASGERTLRELLKFR